MLICVIRKLSHGSAFEGRTYCSSDGSAWALPESVRQVVGFSKRLFVRSQGMAAKKKAAGKSRATKTAKGKATRSAKAKPAKATKKARTGAKRTKTTAAAAPPPAAPAPTPTTG